MQIDPATGQQYSGYDIMCHRISIGGAEGFATPKFSELIISEATAQEIKKQKIKEIHLDTSSITVISPNGGEIWKSGETHRIKWNSRGISSIRIYIYNSKAAGSGSTINITPNNQLIPAVLGYYDWYIPSINQLPSGAGGNNYKIIIDDAYYPGEKRDESDSLFSIVATVSQYTCGCSDANGDGWISPIDALTIINTINSTPTKADRCTGGATYDVKKDINRDGCINETDTQCVITDLNANGSRKTNCNDTTAIKRESQLASILDAIKSIIEQIKNLFGR